jgi:NifU-like protein involved in Fe-S cluster formation
VSAGSKLYTQQVLNLAVRLAQWPIDPAMPFQGKARSPSCGSVLSISLALDDSSHISGLGISAQACAIGQASAAIFADHAIDQSADDLNTALAQFENWLQGERDLPPWPGLEVIAAAKDYPARHGAVLLPWKAALDALP